MDDGPEGSPTDAMGSAGILVYMSDGKRTRVVLGREQYAHNWKGSLKWSDFGGRTKEGEDAVATAAREFYEETLGVFGDLKMVLRTKQYDFKLTVRRQTSYGMMTKRLYVVKVPWDPTISQRYHGRREHLKAILFAVAKTRNIQRELAKNRLPVPDYLHRVNRQMVLITELDAIEHMSNGTYRVRVLGSTAEDQKYLGKLGPPTEMTIDVPKETADLYAQLIQTKSWLDRLIAAFPEDVAKRAIVYKNMGPAPAYLPFVRREFLEKDEIRGWRIPELVRALRRRDHLRLSFGAPLKLALRELGNAPKHKQTGRRASI